MFSNVIVGVDGCDGGRDAVALAKALSSGRLTLVGAYPADEVPSRGFVAGYEQLLRDDMHLALESARVEADVDADLVPCGDDSPARALHRTAEHLGADLIVVGSAHHGQLGRLLLGDVGRGVLHDAPCPVAVAPRRFGGVAPRTIAVGFDGSAEATAALNLAARYVSDRNAALTVLIAWQDPPLPIAEAAAYDINQMQEARRKWADDLLAETLAGLPSSTAGQVLHGRPDIVLAEKADRFGLLFVGSRCWGPVKRVTVGSTADRLVHGSPCPVIVVPRPPAAESSSEEPLSGVSAAGDIS